MVRDTRSRRTTLSRRLSATRDAGIRDQPEGTVVPWLKTLSFWDGDGRSWP